MDQFEGIICSDCGRWIDNEQDAYSDLMCYDCKEELEKVLKAAEIETASEPEAQDGEGYCYECGTVTPVAGLVEAFDGMDYCEACIERMNEQEEGET